MGKTEGERGPFDPHPLDAQGSKHAIFLKFSYLFPRCISKRGKLHILNHFGTISFFFFFFLWK